MKYIATIHGQEFVVELEQERRVIIDGEPYEIDFRFLESGGITSLLMNHRSVAALVEPRRDESRDNVWEVLISGELYSVQVQDERAYRLARSRGSGLSVDGEALITSPMPGIIVAVPVKEGDVVRLGDKIVILESMKMENELRAPCDGVVVRVNVGPGAGVEKDQVLVVISQELE
jgi:pyruvate carboxylase subunit B